MTRAISFLQGTPFVLAPLAGYTDLPFRLLCRGMGAAMVCSEMISSHGLLFAQEKTLSMLATHPDERPVSFQLFGADPQVMGEAARLLSALPIDCIDINMGCPVRKVIKKGAGAALMKDMRIAEAIIRAVCAQGIVPVSVKFRAGWQTALETAPEFGLMAQEAGAAVLVIHARSWAQGFSGQADWQTIRRVKEWVRIPVIGNGDVLCYADGLRMMAQTGCDGVMIGRGALGNPWVFQSQGKPDTLTARLSVAHRYLELAERHMDTRQLLFRIKGHVSRLFGGLPGASRIRQKLYAAPNFSQLTGLVSAIEEEKINAGETEQSPR